MEHRIQVSNRKLVKQQYVEFIQNDLQAFTNRTEKIEGLFFRR